MTGLLSLLGKSKCTAPAPPCHRASGELRQPRVLELCCSLAVPPSCRNPALFCLQLLARGAHIGAEWTVPSLGQCWCSLRWLIRAPWGWASLGRAAKIPRSLELGACLPHALVSPLLSAISPGSQAFATFQVSFFSSVFQTHLFPNFVFSPQCLEFLRLSCLLFLLGSLILADECKAWVINCQ